MSKINALLVKAEEAGFSKNEKDSISSLVEQGRKAAEQCNLTGVMLNLFGLGSLFGSHSQYVRIDEERKQREWDRMTTFSNRVFDLTVDIFFDSLTENCSCKLKKQ